MSEKKFTAREVQDALEGLTWTEEHPVYKRDDSVPGWFKPYKRDENGNRVVDHMESYTYEFEWGEAERNVGHTYDVLGGVTVVASDPGGEGHGENIWVVVRTDETGQTFRIDGYYASYGDGSQYDDVLREVRAQEKTVIVYE